jgi:pSer/pThr/pTyr-binding forkhead associated (FHA) protein
MTVARILVVQEEGEGAEYVLKPEPTSVGRAPDSAIRLPFPDVSRQHAMVFPVEGGYKIVDRGSPNGLFVNGSRVKEHALQDGDVIQVGRRKLIFRT